MLMVDKLIDKAVKQERQGGQVQVTARGGATWLHCWFTKGVP